MNKMVMAVILKDEAKIVLDALIDAGHTATFMETKGGMLRQSQYSLFIAVKDNDLESVCSIIEKNCKMDITLDDEGMTKQELLETPESNKLCRSIVFIWELDKVVTY
jgi:uncharacterized protein YaaQ